MRLRIIVVAVITLSVVCCIFLIREPANAFYQVRLPAPVASFSPTATPSSSIIANSTGWPNSTLIAALIGLGGVILSIIVGGITSIYQTRRNERLQREMARQNDQLQRELLRTQKELEREYAFKAQQEQHNFITAETNKENMLRAKTNDQRAQVYREMLKDDPRIASLQILEMERPLAVLNVYVRLRIHQETRSRYSLDPVQHTIETLHDPNTLLEVEQERRERRRDTELDPDEALLKFKRCVIVGDPGAGKTTLLKYLTLKLANKELSPNLPDFPIYIELNAFVASGISELIEFAAIVLDGFYAFPKKDAQRYLEEQLDMGKVFFLLDALDETLIGDSTESADDCYIQVSKAIQRLATRYPKSSIVVTVRKAGYQQHAPLSGFTELEVLDFRREDIRQFITNWYTSSRDIHRRKKISDLILRLERNPRIQALAANPLLLSLIVLVYDAQLDLPDRRADLYERCMNTLLMEWDAKRNIRRRREFKPEHKRQLLEMIAWHFHVQGRRYFPEKEVLSKIAAFLPTVGLSVEPH